MQKLFDAALRDNSDFNKPPTRLVPSATFPSNPALAPLPIIPAPQPETEPAVTGIEAPASEFTAPLPNAGLGEAASNELKVLLDEQMARLSLKRRNASITTLALLFSLVGGGYAWFVQSPSRVQAYHSAITEVRSVGDITSILAKYQTALDRIGTHSANLDLATESMGVSSNQDDAKDVHFEAEMKAMTGAESKTTGERSSMLTSIKTPGKQF